jgi:hypothetical protein
MIQEFINTYMERKGELEKIYSEKRPEDYLEIVRNVVSILKDVGDYGRMSPDRIREIDDGDYQGTLVYVIAEEGYQPSDYWYVRVCYGSCSGCDTLQEINAQSCGDQPTEQQVKDYMTLSLHIVEGLKKMGGELV